MITGQHQEYKMDILVNNELLIGLVILVFAALLCLIVIIVQYLHLSRPQNSVVNNNTPCISYISLNVGKIDYNVKQSKRRSKQSVRPNGFARRSASKTTAYFVSKDNESIEKKRYDEKNHCGWFTDSGCDESLDVYCKHKEHSGSILCIKSLDESYEILTRSENKPTCSLTDLTKRPDHRKQEKSDIVYELDNSECVKHDESKESNIHCGDRNCKSACEVTSVDYERKYNVENHFEHTDSVDDGSYTVTGQNDPENDLDCTDAVDDGSYTVSDRLPCQDFELGIESTNRSSQLNDLESVKYKYEIDTERSNNEGVLEYVKLDSMPPNTNLFANASTTIDVVMPSSKSNGAESLRPIILFTLQAISTRAQFPLIQVILVDVFNPLYISLLRILVLQDLNPIQYSILRAMFTAIRRSPVMATMYFRVSISRPLQTESINVVNLMSNLQKETKFQKGFNPIQCRQLQSLYPVPSNTRISNIYESCLHLIPCTRSTRSNMFEICILYSRPFSSCDIFKTFRPHSLLLDANSLHESVRTDVGPSAISNAAEMFDTDSKPANTNSTHSFGCFLPDLKQQTGDSTNSFQLHAKRSSKMNVSDDFKPDRSLSTTRDVLRYDWQLDPLLFSTNDEYGSLSNELMNELSLSPDVLSFTARDELGSFKSESNISTSDYTSTNACVLSDSNNCYMVGTSKRFLSDTKQSATSEEYERFKSCALSSTTSSVYPDSQPDAEIDAYESLSMDSMSSSSSDDSLSLNVSFSSVDSEASLTLVYSKSTTVSIQSGKQNELDCRSQNVQRFEDIHTRPRITGIHNEQESRGLGLETVGNLRTRQQEDDTTFQPDTYQGSQFETHPDELNQERNESLPPQMTVFQFGKKNSVVESNGLCRHDGDIVDEDLYDGSIKETTATKCRVLQIYPVKQERDFAVIPSTFVERGTTMQRVDYTTIDLDLVRGAVYPVHGRCRLLCIQLGDDNIVTVSGYGGISNADEMSRHIHAQETQPVGYETYSRTREYGPARRYYKSYVQDYMTRQHSVRTENQT